MSASGSAPRRPSNRIAALALAEQGRASRPEPGSDLPADRRGRGVRSALARILKWLVVLLVLAGVGTAGAYWGPKLYRQFAADRRAAKPGATDRLHFYLVAPKDLRIGVVEDGHLRAVKHHKIASELKHHRAVISWVIKEGAKVEKGDKILEFERKDIEKNIKQQEESLETARRQLVVAEENLKIEKSAGESAVAAAETHLKATKQKLRKYKQLEAPKKFKDLQKAITDARNGLKSARDALTAALEALDEHMFDEEDSRKKYESDVAGKRSALAGAEKKVSAAILTRKMFQAYDYPEALGAKKQAVANAELDLRKARVAAKSSVLQREDELKRARERIKRTEKQLGEYREELDNCVVKAPAEGMILYGDPNYRGYHYYSSDGDANKVKVGGKWWKGSTILTIPDFSKFEIDISIAEEYRGKLKKGCPAEVTIEAIPDLRLRGKLKHISSLAQPRVRWDRSSPKVFKGKIELNGGDNRMVSGMTTRVEIVAETVKDALAVPIESVFNEDGKPVVYVRRGERGFERREVRPGKSNDDEVEILSGLAEGEETWLIHPHRAGLPVSAGSAPDGSRK
jgi:HlyD family secretion protein